MSQSLSKMYLHLVFSTKMRKPVLSNSVRNELHAYLATVLKNTGCSVILINSTNDHVHILFEMVRTLSVSQVVEEVKKSSSKWVKTKAEIFKDFAWQNGYGIFSVSESNVEAVHHYISQQEEHHRKQSFQDELRAILEKHGVTYDEKYLWD